MHSRLEFLEACADALDTIPNYAATAALEGCRRGSSSPLASWRSIAVISSPCMSRRSPSALRLSQRRGDQRRRAGRNCLTLRPDARRKRESTLARSSACFGCTDQRGQVGVVESHLPLDPGRRTIREVLRSYMDRSRSTQPEWRLRWKHPHFEGVL